MVFVDAVRVLGTSEGVTELPLTLQPGPEDGERK